MIPKKVLDSFKKDLPETRLIIDGFIQNEREGGDRYNQLIKRIILKGCKNAEEVSIFLAPAEDAALKTAYANALTAATTKEEVEAVNNAYQWQKSTKKHNAGEWKVTILPMAYKSAKSVISSALELGISLVDLESGEVMGKTALEKKIKKVKLAIELAKKEKAADERKDLEEKDVWDDGEDEKGAKEKILALITNTIAPLLGKIDPDELEEIEDNWQAICLTFAPAPAELQLDKTGTEE